MSSTIVSLPNELQLDIFHALHDSDVDKLANQDNLRTVTNVCRHWRQLAVNTSAFWTFIFVDENSVDLKFPFVDAYAVDGIGALHVFPWIVTLLQRSGVQPIDICVNLRSDYFDPALTEYQNQAAFPWNIGHVLLLSRILGAHAARFRTVEIFSELWQPIQGIATALVGVPMPLLEVWNVTRGNFQWGHRFDTDLDSGACMPAIECPVGMSPSEELNTVMYPRLRAITLQGVLQNWSQLIPRNLVSLDLSYIPLHSRPTAWELKALLLASQFSLESLSLWAATPISVVGEKITLPNLTFLSLGVSFPDTTQGLADYLDIPSLRRLELYDMTHQNPSNFADGQAMYNTTWSLFEFLLHMVGVWPMRKLTHLTLRSPSFHLSDLDDVDAAFADGELLEEGDLPVPLVLLFSCSSLKNLRIIDPDLGILRALVSPVRHKDIPSGVLAVPSLELLQIETTNLAYLGEFFQRNTHWCRCPPGGVTPRSVDSILLDVPPEWGGLLRTLVTNNTAKEILNGKGYFEVGSADPSVTGASKVFDLLSN
ncbi:hypothetical protein BT96DRAFT_194756 [Gymnopus androsaceus JB14]|uniref:F-box domain-containing protein n=1 Tax=Gymnopus androsaceus JB14 TaxID=1447944 RepID=A0A6A4HAU3_9AGAR|nr:hypothetical protein BT96DRAFT_194756 [Gymnopus androsaceus JB14]